jgi:hypothetical protein
VADEPSNADLARQLADIRLLLQQVVGRPEYTADQRLAEHRFTEIERDIEDVRRTHVDDIKDVNRRTDDVNRRIEDHAKASGTNLRQALYNGLLPAIFLVVGLLVTILLAFKGGK